MKIRTRLRGREVKGGKNLNDRTKAKRL